MAFKLKELLEGGHVNTFQTDEGNYVLVLAFKDMGFVVPLLKVKGVGNVGFVDIPTSVAPQESIAYIASINDFVVNTFSSLYNGLPRFGSTLTQAAPTHSKKIVSFCQPSKPINKGEDAVVEKYLTDAGYDITALKAGICIKTKQRDYTALRATPEGKRRYEENDNALKAMGVEWKDYSYEVKATCEAIRNGKQDGVILVGPAGNGKSVTAQAIARELGAPVLVFQYSGGTKEEEIVGSYKPSEDKPGAFEHFHGVLTKGATEGYVVVGNEVNFSKAEIQSIHNQFLDSNVSTITIDGVDYPKNPNFVLILTMNPSYEGTEELNEALRSRFSKIVVPQLSVDDFAKRLNIYSKHMGSELSIPFFRQLYDIGKIIQSKAIENGENAEICIRNGKHLVNLITNEPLTEAQFVECFHVAYTNEICFETGNLEDWESFKKNSDLTTKIKALFGLYTYRNIETKTIEASLGSLLQEDMGAAGGAKGKRNAGDDFGLDEDDLDSIDEESEAVFDKLAQEVQEDTTPVPSTDEGGDTDGTNE